MPYSLSLFCDSITALIKFKLQVRSKTKSSTKFIAFVLSKWIFILPDPFSSRGAVSRAPAYQINNRHYRIWQTAVIFIHFPLFGRFMVFFYYDNCKYSFQLCRMPLDSCLMAKWPFTGDTLGVLRKLASSISTLLIVQSGHTAIQ